MFGNIDDQNKVNLTDFFFRSYGILLHEIFTSGQMPYQGISNSDVRTLVLTKNYRLPKIKTAEFQLPDNIYEIMLNCWEKMPEKRPTFERLRYFFEDYTTDSDTNYIDVQTTR